MKNNEIFLYCLKLVFNNWEGFVKILVGSKNPVKIKSVEEAFANYFNDLEVAGFEVESGVPVQPVNDETFTGARNRALNLKKLNEKNNLNGDYFVGIEGGIAESFGKWFAFGCMCVVDKTGDTGYGTSPGFELPQSVITKLLHGVELGAVMDEIMNESNTKQRGGAIGFFTNGVMSRKELYIEGLKAALVPFLHKEMFFEKL